MTPAESDSSIQHLPAVHTLRGAPASPSGRTCRPSLTAWGGCHRLSNGRSGHCILCSKNYDFVTPQFRPTSTRTRSHHDFRDGGLRRRVRHVNARVQTRKPNRVLDSWSATLERVLHDVAGAALNRGFGDAGRPMLAPDLSTNKRDFPKDPGPLAGS